MNLKLVTGGWLLATGKFCFSACDKKQELSLCME